MAVIIPTVPDDAPFYGADPVYVPWPGQVTAKPICYQFRFGAGQDVAQGLLSTCAAIIDVPDVTERLTSISIAASGTRLPITKTYTAIKNVQLTLEADGGTAVGVKIGDRDPGLGPLIYCLNSSGVAVSGKVDAYIQGY